MSFETLPGGGLGLRIQIRTFEDGFTRAGIQMGDGKWFVLCQVSSVPYERSPAVQSAFIELSQQLVRDLVSDADPDLHVTDLKCVEPGAPVDGAKH